MSDEQKEIIELNRLLGLALGALEVIQISPLSFNSEGVKYVIDTIKNKFDSHMSMKMGE